MAVAEPDRCLCIRRQTSGLTAPPPLKETLGGRCPTRQRPPGVLSFISFFRFPFEFLRLRLQLLRKEGDDKCYQKTYPANQRFHDRPGPESGFFIHSHKTFNQPEAGVIKV